MIRRAALVAAIALASCAHAPRASLNPHLPLLPLPITADLRRWWQEVETCTGERGEIEDVRFYMWADTLLAPNGLPLDGMYVRDAKVVVVVAYDPRIIRHEMVHALTPWDSGGHLPKWGEQCGRLIRWP